MKGLIHKSKGFTLIELMVVMTILSVLAGIVVPAVTGTTTVGKGTALTSDIVTVQQAVDRFAGDNPGGVEVGWPTADGKIPDPLATSGAQNVPIDWGKYFSDPKTGEPKVFLIHYLRGSVSHSGATRDGTGDSRIDSLIFGAKKPSDITDANYGKLTDGNVAVTVSVVKDSTSGKITSTTVTRTASSGSLWPAGPTNIAKDADILGIYPVWRVDKFGKVVVVMSDSEY